MKNAFGLFGIDFVVKSADGKILNDDLFKKINNELVIIQKNNNSLENVKIHHKTLPITEYVVILFDRYFF